MFRAGFFGGVLASVCFMLPSSVLMILFGYGVSAAGNLYHAGWLHGLKLAATAVVAQAVWGMSRTLCPDAIRISTALVAATVALLLPGSLIQIVIIIAGGVIGWLIYRKAPLSVSGKLPRGLQQNHFLAGGILALFFSLLLILPLLAERVGIWGQLFGNLYHAGSLVFGGGHVVLPLLRSELFRHGLIGDDTFLAGYGAVQAMPGPLFTFAAYLGTVIIGGSYAWIGGFWCLFALFLPSWLLVAGTLPYWDQLRTKSWVKGAMLGVNAAVVGILLAALYNPLWKESISTFLDFILAVTFYVLLSPLKSAQWIVVLLAAAIGQLFL
jgi:chromate transporter